MLSTHIKNMAAKMMNKQNILEIKNLKISFNSFGQIINAVNGLSFNLEKGEILGIVGESGSGKSVTAHSILKLLPIDQTKITGEIKFYGNEILNAPVDKIKSIRGNKIAMIFQEPMSCLNPLYNIEKQITETIFLHNPLITKNNAKKEVLRLLNLVKIKNPENRLKSYPFELSGGECQRVMIAMALANNPDILIADEPTTALDVTVQAELIQLLLDLQKKFSMSVIFISHDLNVISKVASKVVVMYKGQAVEYGKTFDIINNPKNDYTKTLISSILQGEPVVKIQNNPQEILKVKNLNVDFKIKKGLFEKKIILKAVNNVSFSLNKGETLGIVGESGSGKTTIVQAILRLIKSEGQIFFDNLLINNLPINKMRKIRKNMQIVFQDPYSSLNPKLNILQIVSEGLEIFFPKMPQKQIIKTVKETLQKVGLPSDILNRFPYEFSGGQRQRIAIARAIIINPKLLILDEPTSSLDVTVQKQIIELLKNIQETLNVSYIFISHDLRAVREISDNIMVIQNGQIIEIGKNKQIFNNPKLKYTKKLISAALKIEV